MLHQSIVARAIHANRIKRIKCIPHTIFYELKLDSFFSTRKIDNFTSIQSRRINFSQDSNSNQQIHRSSNMKRRNANRNNNIRDRQAMTRRDEQPFNSKYSNRNSVLFGQSKTRISINLPFPTHHPIYPHLHTCLSEVSNNHNSQAKSDTGFHFAVNFLGTGGNIPTMNRNTSSTVLRFGGGTFLFDAGEGLQKQLNFTTFGTSTLQKVFITHMHADHVVGLPSLLLNMQTSTNASMDANLSNLERKGKNKELGNDQAPELDIYGPPGLYHYIGTSLRLTHSKLNMKVTVHELMGSKAQEYSRVRLNPEPEQFYRNLHYNVIHPKTSIDGTNEEDGIHWNISNMSRVGSRDNNHRNRSFSINAVEIEHAHGVPTFSYIVEEPTPLPPIDREKAIVCGVNPGKKYELLKSGVSVESDDGSGKIVTPEEVLIMEKQKKGRKFVLLGDNSGKAVGSALHHFGEGCDVLVNECTSNDHDHRVSIHYF